MGKVCVFQQPDHRINTGKTDPAQVEAQLKILDQAVAKTLGEISGLKVHLQSTLSRDSSLVLEVYKAVLEDQPFLCEIRHEIRENRKYAECAVDLCFQRYLDALEESGNEYMQQRVIDLQDIRWRLIKNILGGSEPMLGEIHHKQIVVVNQLTPTLAAALGRRKVMGIAAQEGGGFFSHSAIILRGLGIPALNDVNYANLVKTRDQFAILDGQDGFLIINPEPQEISRYREILKRSIQQQKALVRGRKRPAVTLDGQRIYVAANVGNLEEGILAKERNADGIGLVRTELMFADHERMPGEKEQFVLYSKIIKRMRNKPVIFRTMDYGGDKIPRYMTSGTVLGDPEIRGITRSLLEPEQLAAQIRALLRVSPYGNVSISFPMVHHRSQLIRAREIIASVMRETFSTREKDRHQVKVGAVIESAEGLSNLEEILEEADFISIGTNDLFWQFKGGDRARHDPGEKDYLDPAFLKMVQHCIEQAGKRGKKVLVCGEMAADPLACILLVGMGLRNISVVPSKIGDMKALIEKIRFSDAKRLVRRACRKTAAGEVRAVGAQWMGEKVSEANV